MAIDVIMPQMGFDMREGTVVNWLKAEGDDVERGEAIAEIETDKATVELEAFTNGTLGRIYVEAGTTVPVGDVIAVITAAGEEVPDRAETLAGARSADSPDGGRGSETEQSQRPASPAAAFPLGSADGRQVAVTPVARRIAEEAGVGLDEVRANVSGSGPNGRIVRSDIESYLTNRTRAAASAPRPQAVEAVQTGIVVPGGLSPMRQAIARRMSVSKLTVPHYYVTVDVDTSRVVDLRRELNEELPQDERISLNDMIMRAVAKTLIEHQHFNVTVLPEGIRPNGGVPISIAVAMDGGGLLGPGLPDVSQFTLRQLAVATRDLVARARSGRLRAEELSGTGFTISNLGMYDVREFVAIITPPNAGAIAVGSVKETPVVKSGEVVVGQVMAMTLSADHRATDGAEGAEFMNSVRRVLEKPTTLLV